MAASSRTIIFFLALASLAIPAFCADSNMLTNADFASGLTGWELYGRDKAGIKLTEDAGPDGANCAVVPCAHASISQNMDLAPGKLYELSFRYRRSSPDTLGDLVFFLNTNPGINASAGVINLDFPREGDRPAGDWEEFREAFRTPSGTCRGKVVLGGQGSGDISYAHVRLRELPADSKPGVLLPTADWSRLRKVRTRNPVFGELLSDSPGHYTTVAWTTNLNKAKLPPELASRFTDAQWQDERMAMFREAGEAGMNYYGLPGNADIADDVFKRFGVRFDVSNESSGVRGAAIKAGAEMLNNKKRAISSVDPSVSWVDPVYVAMAEQELRRNAERFKGQPYVFCYVGKDEPTVQIHEGPMSHWQPFSKRCAEEVLREYGFGRYAMPAPGDPEYVRDTADRPFRWIAYNRWMAAKYAESKKQLYQALKSVDPKALYNPCDYWFMSGFTPYDFALMGKYSDIVESDPYASSAERRKGRGLYNHGFGPKFLRDITGKPVRAIVQAFDYAGYEMAPEDLLEWVSQSLRAGASHISYYQMDNPRFTDPDRWKMMMHISKTITGMKELKLPDDPEVAVLYSADTARGDGLHTGADELYTAYSLLGERVGSWFDFVDDDSLARGEKSLSKYKAVYIPRATYQRESVVKQIADFVKDGGTVICGDPAVFSRDIDGSDLSHWRSDIFGVTTLGRQDREQMVLGDSEWTKGLRPGDALPVYRTVGRGGWYDDNGWQVKTAKSNVKIIAKFADGSPAITVSRYGKGQAVYFAANPFAPECLFYGEKWDGLFRAFQKHLGAKTARPIWHFRLPVPTR